MYVLGRLIVFWGGSGVAMALLLRGGGGMINIESTGWRQMRFWKARGPAAGDFIMGGGVENWAMMSNRATPYDQGHLNPPCTPH